MQDIVEVCRMFGDPTRLAIVEQLARAAMSVGQLCKKMGLPQPSMSHHLGLLRHTGIVNRERKGKQRIYSLNRKQLAPLKKFLGKIG